MYRKTLILVKTERKGRDMYEEAHRNNFKYNNVDNII